MRVDRIASVASFFVSRVDTRGRQAARRAHGCRRRRAARAARAPAGQGRHRPGQARLRRRSATKLRRRALRPAGARGRAPAATALGQHLDQEPRLPRRLLRRGADRPRHGQHHAAGDAARLQGSRPPREPARAQASTAPAACWHSSAQVGIDMDAVTAQLETRGRRVLRTLVRRAWSTPSPRRREAMRVGARTRPRLGPAERAVARALAELARRTRRRAPVGEGPDAVEAPARHPGARGDRHAWLGWLDAVDTVSGASTSWWPSTCARAGFTRALLCGMGGSSLPAEVLRRSLRRRPRLARPARCSTPPIPRRCCRGERGDPARTLYVLCRHRSPAADESTPSSASSGRSARDALGDAAGSHFAAIARSRRRARVARAGSAASAACSGPRRRGRPLGSALSPRRARAGGAPRHRSRQAARARPRMATACGAVVPPRHNPGLWLGAVARRARPQRARQADAAAARSAARASATGSSS